MKPYQHFFEVARQRAKQFLNDCDYSSVEKRNEALALISRIWLDGYGHAIKEDEELHALIEREARAESPVVSSATSSAMCCKVCGCTSTDSCMVVDLRLGMTVTCCWVEPGLCDGCCLGDEFKRVSGPKGSVSANA